MNSALVRLGNDWMLHVDAIRRPGVGYPEGGAFPDPTTRLLDDERHERYTAEAVTATGARGGTRSSTSSERRLNHWKMHCRRDSAALLTYLRTCITGLQHLVHVPTKPCTWKR